MDQSHLLQRARARFRRGSGQSGRRSVVPHAGVTGDAPGTTSALLAAGQTSEHDKPDTGHDMLAERARLPRWMRPLVITIDGPAGSGKSTIARLLAESLGFQYVDTGATYRALAWRALDTGVDLADEDELVSLARREPVLLAFDSVTPGWRVRIGGVDVTDEIRTPRIDEAASKVARHPRVRECLVERQREIVGSRDSVLDGRDCGTRIIPDADLKVLVTADFEERVRRRAGQFTSDAAGDTVAETIRARDERDAPQSVAADDAVVLDTTSLDIDASVARLVEMWLERRGSLLDGETTGGRTALDWISNAHEERFERTLKTTRLIWERGFRLRVHGAARVPERNCMFIANHSSMWDPAFLVVPLRRRIRFMGKVELTKVPLVKDLADSVGMFPVRRGAGDRVALHIAESILRGGDSLGIFPEGTRVYEGALGRPRAGAARLALVTGVPIVPVAILGNRWRESLLRVDVAFGEPHYVDGLSATPSNVAAATNAVWADVLELWEAMRRGRSGL